jgi:hypothetical protein
VTSLEILEQIASKGAFIHQGEYADSLRELLDQGLIVRVSDIPHHRYTLNPSYTFVSNDEAGRKLAKEKALFTISMD